jgi:hypothetical protein
MIVSVGNMYIKNDPFPALLRLCAPYSGQFHACLFLAQIDILNYIATWRKSTTGK